MTFGDRLRGVLRLDVNTFEEIEADRSATGQALVVVVLGSLAAGFGAGLLGGPFGLLRTTLTALVGWVVWAGLTYVIGTRMLPEPQTSATLGQVMRTLGFAYAPILFAVFGFIPFVGWIVRFVVALWLLAATVVAVRQALDYRSTLRAVAVVAIGWIVYLLLTLVFA